MTEVNIVNLIKNFSGMTRPAVDNISINIRRIWYVSNIVVNNKKKPSNEGFL